MILVDSNVIIDVLFQDPTWRAWSESALIEGRSRRDRDQPDHLYRTRLGFRDDGGA